LNIRKILTIAAYVLVPALLLTLALHYVGQARKEKIVYSDLLNAFYANEVAYYSLNLSSGALEYWGWDQMQEKDGKFVPADKEKGNSKQFNLPSVDLFVMQTDEIVQQHNQEHLDSPKDQIQVNLINGGGGSWLIQIIPTVLIGGMVVTFVFLMMRRMNSSIMSENNKSMSFGKARLKQQGKDEKRKITFADVAGADEEKEELAEIVGFLKDPKRFNDLGARIPKGVLLVGPPGTGKTYLAKAVAGEADVPFFSISGSDFVELYVGVGASRVRDMFAQAKKHAPAIVFIDEIDAVGRQRGAGMGGGHDEREQTLNQLLVEMDGFGTNEGVIIIAATNRPDILDPALLRPGRFDRQVTVLVPDVRGREAILKVHARNKPLGPDVDLKVIAQTTAGFTGADLENLLNEAALLSARMGKKAITHEEIESAMLKVVVGTEKKSHKKTEKDLTLTAYHEAGHAVASFYLESQDDVHQISIISRGLAGGFTMYLPTEDKDFVSKTDMEESIVSLLGGRVAESLTLDDISTGASSDIERATKLARDMVTRYGMSELGTVAYTSGHDEIFLGRDYGQTRSYSEHMAQNIDLEIKRFIDSAYARCKKILQENMEQLQRVAKVLIRFETITGEQFLRVMRGEELPELAEA